uniref:Uncharacterized protein n=1 Tax=Latimeria chalumnae TaxID=7897 RepID=H3A3T4_LATCH
FTSSSVGKLFIHLILFVRKSTELDTGAPRECYSKSCVQQIRRQSHSKSK